MIKPLEYARHDQKSMFPHIQKNTVQCMSISKQFPAPGQLGRPLKHLQMECPTNVNTVLYAGTYLHVRQVGGPICQDSQLAAPCSQPDRRLITQPAPHLTQQHLWQHTLVVHACLYLDMRQVRRPIRQEF